VTYLMGHVKHDPTTGSVAVRTRFDDTVPEQARRAWLIASPISGPRSTTPDEVADWPDLYTPPAAE
jgi:hypothetical protein